MSGSLAGALDLTGTCHLGKQDGCGKGADSFDAAEQLMIAGELLLRADLLGDMSFSTRLFSALSAAMMRCKELRTPTATPSKRFFSACNITESSSRRRTRAWSCATSSVGGCQGAGFMAQTKSA